MKRRTKIRMELDAIERSLSNYERLLRVYAAVKAGTYGKKRAAP